MASEHQRLVADALLKAKQKLEAIKSWYKAQVEVYSHTRDSCQGKTREHASINLRDLKRLGEILEAGG